MKDSKRRKKARRSRSLSPERLVAKVLAYSRKGKAKKLAALLEGSGDQAQGLTAITDAHGLTPLHLVRRRLPHARTPAQRTRHHGKDSRMPAVHVCVARCLTSIAVQACLGGHQDVVRTLLRCAQGSQQRPQTARSGAKRLRRGYRAQVQPLCCAGAQARRKHRSAGRARQHPCAHRSLSATSDSLAALAYGKRKPHRATHCISVQHTRLWHPKLHKQHVHASTLTGMYVYVPVCVCCVGVGAVLQAPQAYPTQQSGPKHTGCNRTHTNNPTHTQHTQHSPSNWSHK